MHKLIASILLATCVHVNAFSCAFSAKRNIVFPADSGVVNVKEAPYNAKGDGTTDDTAAIQAALSANANGDKIIYLPAGTYLVSDTLKWGDGKHGGMAQKRTILQGQSMDKTIIKLKDNCPGYEKYTLKDGRKPEKSKAVIWTGKAPAQRFRNGIRDLTVNTGKGNPGASGIQYIANNQGSMRYVRIVSEDGAGAVGLDLGYTNEQGPCLIYKVEVEGFDFGILCWGPVDSITMEYIRLKGQKKFGLYNDSQCISVRRLSFEGECPAIGLYRHNVVAALEDLKLTGTGKASSVPAIDSDKAYLYVRNLKSSGFKQAIRSGDEKSEKDRTTGDPEGHVIKDYCSREAEMLFPSPAEHLRLPIKETPETPLHPLEDWVSPAQFGGNPDDKEDDTEAIQKAIDSGGKVLYFPYGKQGWTLEGTVEVRGNIEVVTALENRINGNGTIRIVDGATDMVWLKRLDLIYRGIKVEHATSRSFVISGMTFGKGHLDLKGKGELFLADVCMGRLEIPKDYSVWARQLNVEHKGDKHPDTPEKIVNDGGSLWILGYKTEQAGCVLRTKNGGKSTIFGGFIYAQGAPKQQPMLMVENASLSATFGEVCWNFGKQGYHVLAKVTRGEDTQELKGGSKAGRYWHANGASAVPLFVEYEK